MSEIPQANGEKVSTEIERKFWLRNLPDNLEKFPHQDIQQGYLAIGMDGTEVRLRKRDDVCTMTVKSKGDLSRGEWESEITPEQFDTYWPATNGKRIEKTRFSIPLDTGETVELDIYYGELAGLVTAEVEFPSEEAARDFVVPEWLATAEDVTSEKSFKNQQLAINGWPL